MTAPCACGTRRRANSSNTFEPLHEDAVWATVFSPDGSLILSAVRDGSARIWSVAGREMVCEMPIDTMGEDGHRSRIWDADFSPDGTTVLTASGDGTVRLWDAADCTQLQVYRGHEATCGRSPTARTGSISPAVGRT
ncbi:hypothetical protein HC928_16330 [bacterium]|nr:hypothetical protein [bacterium]